MGNPARADLSVEPGNVIQNFKRHMGEDKIYKLDSGPSLNPADASSRVLKKLIQEAEKTVGKIDEVVITIPANFAERQRAATIEAGKKAGVTVKNIINEPTAAALTLATKQKVHGTVLIYDLGGGTFDVTIADVQGQNVECLTSEGDFHLGGVDFDKAICSLVDEAHTSEFGISLKQSLGITSEEQELKSPEWQELLLECEGIKKTLSKRSSQQLSCRSSPSGTLNISISRSDFETKIQDYISKTEMLIETALDNVDMSPSDIDIVLLVGGSTRIPAVKDSLREMFGKEPTESVNPDEAFAIGAAIYAGLSTGESPIIVADVANFYLGYIEKHQLGNNAPETPRVQIVIPRNTKLPCHKVVRLRTKTSDQCYFRLKITQSSTRETDPQFVNVIYDWDIGPLPPSQPIDITFIYDEDGSIHIECEDAATGKAITSTICLSSSNNTNINNPNIDVPLIQID